MNLPEKKSDMEPQLYSLIFMFRVSMKNEQYICHSPARIEISKYQHSKGIMKTLVLHPSISLLTEIYMHRLLLFFYRPKCMNMRSPAARCERGRIECVREKSEKGEIYSDRAVIKLNQIQFKSYSNEKLQYGNVIVL